MDTTDRLKIVNESGFPLQIAVSHLVDSQKPGGWSVRYTEHAWQSADKESSGFVDVVLQNRLDTIYMVVECKRVREVDWIFLAESGATKPRRHSKLWITRFVDGGFKFFGWQECPADPISHEGAFCVIRGQTANGPRPMLERLGSEVVVATEAFARQERDFRQPRRVDLFRAYVSVIVTTAPLYVSSFSPADISLSDGTLQSAKFDGVPYVRFRKQLIGASQPLSPRFESPMEVAYERESTVFIVNASHLAEFLGEFELDDRGTQAFR